MVEKDPLHIYGSDAAGIAALMVANPELATPIHPNTDFTKAEVVWSVRNEMALSVEDILARRQRLLFLDARTAIGAAPVVAQHMAKELGRDEEWVEGQISEFAKLA